MLHVMNGKPFNILCFLNQEAEEKGTELLVPGTRAFAEDDLRRLVAKPRDDDINDDDDMPPLIQALTRSAKHDGKEEILKAQIKVLDEQEQKRKENEMYSLQLLFYLVFFYSSLFFVPVIKSVSACLGFIKGKVEESILVNFFYHLFFFLTIH